MNHLAIIRMLSITGVGFGLLLALCGMVSLASGDLNEVLGFEVVALLLAAPGLIILLLSDKPRRHARPRDGLAFIILLWCLLGVAAALPLHIARPDTTLLACIYDSVSSLTTTGHSVVFDGSQPLTSGILVWRVILHLCGTVLSILSAAWVFAALNLGGPGVHRTRFFTEGGQDFFIEILPLLRIIITLVLGTVIALIAALIALNVPPREALAGAVSVVSTGLVDPGASDIRPSQGRLHGVILWCGLFVGTFGLLLLDKGRGRKLMQRLGDPEIQLWLAILVVITLLALFAGLPLLDSLAWASTSLSTSGIALGETGAHHRLPVIVVLFPALIGGSALSAAGGIKLARVFVLLQRVGQEFVQLGYRGSVQHFLFRGLRQSEKTLMGVWVYMVAYIVACTLGAVLFSISGLFFEDAIKAAIGTVSNAGYLLKDLPENLSSAAKTFAIAGMILGRLEVIALLPALNRSFWQK